MEVNTVYGPLTRFTSTVVTPMKLASFGGAIVLAGVVGVIFYFGLFLMSIKLLFRCYDGIHVQSVTWRLPS